MTCDKCGAAKTGALYCANCRVIELTARVKELEAERDEWQAQYRRIDALAKIDISNGTVAIQALTKERDEARAALAELKASKGLGERVLALLLESFGGGELVVDHYALKTTPQEATATFKCHTDSEWIIATGPTARAALTDLCEKLETEA